MADKLRIILVPRFGAGPGDDWYGWLENKLREHKTFPLSEWVFCELQPEPSKPDLDSCNRHLAQILGEDELELTNTLIVAHSLGAQVALRTLAEKVAGAKIYGLLCAAGWLALDHPASSLRPWTANPVNERAAKERVSKVVNIISNNDPNQMNTDVVSRVWRKGPLESEIIISAKPGHVSDKEEPDVLNALLQQFG